MGEGKGGREGRGGAMAHEHTTALTWAALCLFPPPRRQAKIGHSTSAGFPHPYPRTDASPGMREAVGGGAQGLGGRGRERRVRAGMRG